MLRDIISTVKPNPFWLGWGMREGVGKSSVHFWIICISEWKAFWHLGTSSEAGQSKVSLMYINLKSSNRHCIFQLVNIECSMSLIYTSIIHKTFISQNYVINWTVLNVVINSVVFADLVYFNVIASVKYVWTWKRKEWLCYTIGLI